MHIYASLLLTTWLGHATHGINALRSSVPRIGSDPAPPAVTITQGFRDSDSALIKVPENRTTAWVQIITGLRPMERMRPGVAPYPDDARLSLGIRYIPVANIAPDAMLRDAAYTMTAIERSLTRLYIHPDGEALRQTFSNSYAIAFNTIKSIETDVGYVSDTDTVLVGLMHCAIDARHTHVQS